MTERTDTVTQYNSARMLKSLCCLDLRGEGWRTGRCPGGRLDWGRLWQGRWAWASNPQRRSRGPCVAETEEIWGPRCSLTSHTHTLHKSTQERKRIIPTCHLHQACELTRARGCIPSSLAATRSRCWGRHCCWDACQMRERSVLRWLVHCSVKHNHYWDTKKFSARSVFIDRTIISKMNSGGGQGPFVMPQKADWDFAYIPRPLV